MWMYLPDPDLWCGLVLGAILLTGFVLGGVMGRKAREQS